MSSLIRGKSHRYPCSISSYLVASFIIIGCLFLGTTSATNQTETTDTDLKLVKALKGYVGDILSEGTAESMSNTTNDSRNLNKSETLIEMLNEPLHMSQLRWLLSVSGRVLAQLFIIVS